MNSFDPYGGVPDLQTALASFVQGVKSYKLADTLATANNKVQEIKSSALKDQEKRAELSGLANQLVLQMTAQGASAAETGNVFHALKPILPASADQAVLQGLLEGNTDQIQAGRTAQVLNAQDNLMLQNNMAANQMRIELQKEASQNRLLDKKIANKSEKPLSPDELKSISALDKGMAGLQQLKTMVRNSPGLVGPLAGNIPGRGTVDPAYGAFTTEMRRVLDEYRVAVTGAGASPGELKMLEKANPTPTDTPSSFLRKIEQVTAIGKRNRAIMLKNLGQAGRNVSGFDTETSTPAMPAASGIPGLSFK